MKKTLSFENEYSGWNGKWIYFRNLCDKAVPGNKVTVTGIYSIKRAAKVKGDRGGPKVNFGKLNEMMLVMLVLL